MSPIAGSMPPLCVMVSGAGAPGIRGTVYSLRKNRDGRQVRLVGIDMDPDAIGRRMTDAFYRVPSGDSPDYLNTIVDICLRESVAVILPQTTREVAALSRLSDNIRSQTGAQVVAASPEAIQAANDKYHVLEVFRGLGLPHPEYRITTSESEFVRAVEELGYPERNVVIKPPVSNGMRGFRVIGKSSWDLARFLTEKPAGTEMDLDAVLGIFKTGNQWPRMLVCEYLPGLEFSVDAFVDGNIAVAVPRSRDRIRSGISFDCTVVQREDLARTTLVAASTLGLKYAFGFQFKEDANKVPKVLECNPRIQGTMVASVFAGVNPIWLSIKSSQGWPIGAEEIRVRPARFQRFWGGVGDAGDFIDEI